MRCVSVQKLIANVLVFLEDVEILFVSKSLYSRKPFVLATSSNYRMHSRHHCLLIEINKDKALTF